MAATRTSPFDGLRRGIDPLGEDAVDVSCPHVRGGGPFRLRLRRIAHSLAV
jgi:hypothetical protein